MGKRLLTLLLVVGLSLSGYGLDMAWGEDGFDTSIYGASSVLIRPNVLIILDTSESMDENVDIPSESYDPATTYTGSYTSAAVYYRYNSSWKKVADSVANLCQNETTQLDALIANGQATLKVSSSGACSTSSLNLTMGNFINYQASPSLTYSKRFDVAKEIIAGDNGILKTTSGVNFGLMLFNRGNYICSWSLSTTTCTGGGDIYADGGYIAKEIYDPETSGDEAAYNQQIIDVIKAVKIGKVSNGLTGTSTYTPLAESLAEAGLYFAGATSWFNPTTSSTKTKYTSPIKYECQQNMVILLTDGEPTADDDVKLRNGTTYLNGLPIGDFDKDGLDSPLPSLTISGLNAHPSHYLDDVAKFLHTQDIRPDYPDLTDSKVLNNNYTEQHLDIYTIGFGPEADIPILKSAAKNGTGTDSAYFYATSTSGLRNAFSSILHVAGTSNSVYVAPVVPISRMNRTYAGDSIYIGFFRPEDGGRWSGNLKKYQAIENTGEILDADGNPAMTDEGIIKDSAKSLWNEGEEDGPDVKKGGVGAKLLGNVDARKIYTYLETSTTLSDTANHFVDSNTALTSTKLATTDANRSTLIGQVRGAGQEWVLGDILHSEPVVVPYDTNSAVVGLDEDDDAYIFVGSNDGMLHCFNDTTGAEAWSFIPQDQLGRLKDIFDTTTHDYFVDGVPKMICDGDSNFCLDTGERRILFFGERRGGEYYYALDITNATSPGYKYRIAPSILGDVSAGDEQLGQSWGVPMAASIKTGAGASDIAKVVFLPGGYDADHEDTSPAGSDTKGRAVLAVNLSDGSKSNFKFYHDGGANGDMTHSIVDLNGYDTNEDGLLNRLYAPDLGGNVFAFEDDNKDGNWTKRRLFRASTDGNTRKIFGAPDMAMIAVPSSVTGGAAVGDMIFFGTGDREKPQEGDTTFKNRFYAIKNYWDSASVNLTEDDLCDVTDNELQVGSDEEKASARDCLKNHQGWYIRLPNTGEKVVASPTLYNGVIYFTTFTPITSSSGSSEANPCYSSANPGQGRFYAMDALTATAVLDLSKETSVNGDGNLDTNDRSKVYTSSMPPSPTISVFKDGAKIMLGGEGGIKSEAPPEKVDLHKYYWRQFDN